MPFCEGLFWDIVMLLDVWLLSPPLWATVIQESFSRTVHSMWNHCVKSSMTEHNLLLSVDHDGAYYCEFRYAPLYQSPGDSKSIFWKIEPVIDHLAESRVADSGIYTQHCLYSWSWRLSNALVVWRLMTGTRGRLTSHTCTYSPPFAQCQLNPNHFSAEIEEGSEKISVFHSSSQCIKLYFWVDW